MSATKFQPVFIDIETSGVDKNKHSILSIAALKPTKEYVYIELQYDRIEYNNDALRINGFDIDTVYSDKLMYQIDGGIKTTVNKSKKLLTNFLGKDKNLIAVGFNVGSFDLDFLKRAYGDQFINCIFSFRSVDLNSLIFTESYKMNKNFLTYKRKIGSACQKRIECNIEGIGAHNSLWDCYFAKAVFEYFTK